MNAPAPRRSPVHRSSFLVHRSPSRKTGVLRRADVDLETRARQHAETNIRAEALKRGILKMAADNGEKKLAEFLNAAGIERVRFVNGGAPAAPAQR